MKLSNILAQIRGWKIERIAERVPLITNRNERFLSKAQSDLNIIPLI